MRSILLFAIVTFFAAKVSGQTNEVSLQINSGLFSFGGPSAASSTNAYFGGYVKTLVFFNPYGRKSGFSYGFAIQAQRITKSSIIFGLQTSYESLSSRVKFENTNGYGKLTYGFLNFHPFFGKRIVLVSGINSDLTVGTDLGICLNSKESAIFTNPEHVISGNSSSSRMKDLDIRPRIEFTNYYKNIGLSIGYSFGLTNYISGSSGSNQQVYSRMIRIGITYRL
jgi:hypothetical protein